MPKKTRNDERSITIYNGCPNKVEIHWIHPHTGEESMMTTEAGIFPGTEYTLNSFVDHKFVAREKPVGGVCKNEEKICRQLFFAGITQ